MATGSNRLHPGILIVLTTLGMGWLWRSFGAVAGLGGALAVIAVLVRERRWLVFCARRAVSPLVRQWKPLCLVGCAAVIVGVTWLALEFRRARRERAIIAKLPATGAHVTYDRSLCPDWLRGVLGDEVFTSVEIDYGRPGTVVTDREVACLRGLTRLERLYLGGAPVTDASVPCLETLTGLKELHIIRTGITRAGVNRLKQKLPRCEIFW